MIPLLKVYSKNLLFDLSSLINVILLILFSKNFGIEATYHWNQINH